MQTYQFEYESSSPGCGHVTGTDDASARAALSIAFDEPGALAVTFTSDVPRDAIAETAVEIGARADGRRVLITSECALGMALACVASVFARAHRARLHDLEKRAEHDPALARAMGDVRQHAHKYLDRQSMFRRVPFERAVATASNELGVSAIDAETLVADVRGTYRA